MNIILLCILICTIVYSYRRIKDLRKELLTYSKDKELLVQYKEQIKNLEYSLEKASLYSSMEDKQLLVQRKDQIILLKRNLKSVTDELRRLSTSSFSPSRLISPTEYKKRKNKTLSHIKNCHQSSTDHDYNRDTFPERMTIMASLFDSSDTKSNHSSSYDSGSSSDSSSSSSSSSD